MEYIIRQSESRIASLLAFLFLLGLGGMIPVFFDGFLAWIPTAVFVLLSLLPLDSFLHPQTVELGIMGERFCWANMEQGAKVDEGSLPLKEVRKLLLIKPSVEGQINNISFAQLAFELKNGETVFLPDYLDASVYELKIIEALKKESPSLEIKHVTGSCSEENGEADIPVC